MRTDLLIVGVGNSMRSDDGAGIALAEALAAELKNRRFSPGIRCITCTEPSSLPSLWCDSEHTIVLDAVQASAPAGHIIRLDAIHTPLPPTLEWASSHQLSLGDAVELSRTLDQLPKKLEIIGICGQSFHMGRELSAPVKGAITELLDTLLEEVSGYPQSISSE